MMVYVCMYKEHTRRHADRHARTHNDKKDGTARATTARKSLAKNVERLASSLGSVLKRRPVKR